MKGLTIICAIILKIFEQLTTPKYVNLASFVIGPRMLPVKATGARPIINLIFAL